MDDLNSSNKSICNCICNCNKVKEKTESSNEDMIKVVGAITGAIVTTLFLIFL